MSLIANSKKLLGIHVELVVVLLILVLISQSGVGLIA